jgi:hypothetical protein
MDSLLYRTFSVTLAVSVHIMMAGLLMLIGVEIHIEDDTPMFVRLVPGRGGGEETKATQEPPGDPKEAARAPDPEPPPPAPEPPKPEAAPAPAAASGTAEPSPAPGPNVPNSPPAPNPGPGLDGPSGPVVIGAGSSSGSGPGVSDRDIERDPTDAIRRRRAGSLAGLRGGSDRAILVVSGCYDRVQEVLTKLDLPHRVIAPEQLPKQDLSQCRALLINCHNLYSSGMMKDVNRGELEREVVALEAKVRNLHQRLEVTKDRTANYKLQVELLGATSQLEEVTRRLAASADNAALAKNVGEFVASGGYLFTSDWGLSILERAVPGYVRIGGVVGPRTVTIRPKSGSEGHPMLEEVFLETSKGSAKTSRRFDWDIDSSSYSIKIERPDVVDVLVESLDLARFASVAVTFRHEKGRILHVLSHFQKQATRHGDYALQNMLLNFLVEKWEGHVGAPANAAPLPVGNGSPLTTRFRTWADATRGISMPVPEGWSATKGSGSVAVSFSAPEGATGELRVGPAEPALADGAPGWDVYIRSAIDSWSKERPGATVTRRTQAICSGCPAMLVTWTSSSKDARERSLQMFIAAPDGLYAATWTCGAGEWAALEPVFEKCSRGITVPRK